MISMQMQTSPMTEERLRELLDRAKDCVTLYQCWLVAPDKVLRRLCCGETHRVLNSRAGWKIQIDKVDIDGIQLWYREDHVLQVRGTPRGLLSTCELNSLYEDRASLLREAKKEQRRLNAEHRAACAAEADSRSGHCTGYPTTARRVRRQSHYPTKKPLQRR